MALRSVLSRFTSILRRKPTITARPTPHALAFELHLESVAEELGLELMEVTNG